MNAFVRSLAVFSVPIILMVQFYQGYRYTMILEQSRELDELQKVYLGENKKILAGITVYSAPARIYQVATEILGLKKMEVDKRMLVDFPEDGSQQDVIFQDSLLKERLQNNDEDASLVRIPDGDSTESVQ